MEQNGGMGYNGSMGTSRAKLPLPEPLVESRRAWRQPMTSAVRVGWINDEKRMEYTAGAGIDMAESGLAILAEQRLRLSALVHVEVDERGLVAIGRVRNCVRRGKSWRTGIELVPAS